MEKFLTHNIYADALFVDQAIRVKVFFLTNLILNIINEYDKKYIFSPSLHRDFYQKLIKCCSNYILFHIIPKILNEEDTDIVINEIDINEDIEKSDIEIESYESIDKTKFFPRLR